jgi:hypothetical protein
MPFLLCLVCTCASACLVHSKIARQGPGLTNGLETEGTHALNAHGTFLLLGYLPSYYHVVASVRPRI